MVWIVKALIYCHLRHSVSHRIQTSTIDPWTQTRALIGSSTPAFLGLQVSPPFPPDLSASSSPRKPPSPHQLQPIPCSAGPLPLWPQGLPSQGGQRSFSLQLPQASLRSFRLCVWSPAALQSDTHTTLWQQGETGIPPPVPVNNGLFHSVM